ncbi:MAG TPA: phosphatase PAP2 family protein [Woeseiaceae bacterium]|nr:phosphatase PAP2 family protein [Woeseiaceae bacterium]
MCKIDKGASLIFDKGQVALAYGNLKRQWSKWSATDTTDGDPGSGRIQRVLAWIGSHEPHVLVAFVLFAGAMWTFAELTDSVLEGDTATVDERLLLALREPGDITDPIGPHWFEETARDITGLGGIGILTLVTLIAAGFLALQRKRHTAIYLVLATGSGIMVSTILKWIFARPRPDLVPHAQVVYTNSFPSGHSMMSAVTFLTIGALLAGVQTGVRLKAYLLAVAAMLTLLVGLSRVYLGVHWPTDVLAGWTAGAAWAFLCWIVAEWLRKRGEVE